MILSLVYSRMPSMRKSSTFCAAMITDEFFFLTRFMAFRMDLALGAMFKRRLLCA